LRGSIYGEIHAMMQREGFSIEQACQTTGVSRTGFYRDWAHRAPQQADTELYDAIQRTPWRAAAMATAA
jgi:hypothetical protein